MLWGVGPAYGVKSIRGTVLMFKQLEEFGTPSVPPVMEVGREESSLGVEAPEQVGDGLCEFGELENRYGGGECLLDPTLHSVPSTEFAETGLKETLIGRMEEKMPYCGQHAWQTLIAYDACIRLCLYSWAKGCTEAPEFMRDGCFASTKCFWTAQIFVTASKCSGNRSEIPNEFYKGEEGCREDKSGR
ncbi:hypothetical protein LINPERHAP1_LOCUS15430 [Linum perenne]